MKVIKTENRFKTGFQQPKSSLPKNPVLTSLLYIQACSTGQNKYSHEIIYVECC